MNDGCNEDNNYKIERNSQHAGKQFKHNAFVYFPETDKDLDDKEKKPKATKNRTKKQTMTQTRLINKNNYRHHSLCTISVYTTCIVTNTHSRGAVSISLRMKKLKHI